MSRWKVWPWKIRIVKERVKKIGVWILLLIPVVCALHEFWHVVVLRSLGGIGLSSISKLLVIYAPSVEAIVITCFAGGFLTGSLLFLYSKLVTDSYLERALLVLYRQQFLYSLGEGLSAYLFFSRLYTLGSLTLTLFSIASTALAALSFLDVIQWAD